MIKTLNKIVTEGQYIIKATYDKTIANISMVKRQEYSLSLLLFNIVLEVLIPAIRQEKEIKGIQTAKEEVKLSLLTDDTILYTVTLKFPLKNSIKSNK